MIFVAACFLMVAGAVVLSEGQTPEQPNREVAGAFLVVAGIVLLFVAAGRS